jgi:PPIC-type PPIASE domain
LLLVCAALAGCGATSSPSVVRIGHAAIGKLSVEHWTALIAGGAIVGGPSSDSHGSPRQQALALLISVSWLSGEAKRSGSSLARRRLSELADEQREFAASGETLADLELEAAARWGAALLKRQLEDAAERRARAAVTQSAVATAYHAQIASYRRRERRRYDLIESISTKAEGVKLARRLGAGRRFAVRASKELPFRPSSYRDLQGQAVVYRAVFSARVGVLIGPLPLKGRWALFVLRKIEPARVQSLAEVHPAIERRLLVDAKQRAMAQLIADYRRRWRAQTDCRPRYVVQKCRQYAGKEQPEPPPFAGW